MLRFPLRNRSQYIDIYDVLNFNSTLKSDRPPVTAIADAVDARIFPEKDLPRPHSLRLQDDLSVPEP